MKAKGKGKSKAERRAVTVKVTRLAHGADLPLPAYQTEGSAGLDLLAATDPAHPLFIAPGTRTAVPTGLVLELPPGFEGQVRPRSGLALKQGLTVLNAPGTVDSDYRGEVQVILVNLSFETATVRRGERIAQLIIAPVRRANLVESEALSQTERGAGGFGSTGTASKAEKKPSPESRKKEKSVSKKAKSRAREPKS